MLADHQAIHLAAFLPHSTPFTSLKPTSRPPPTPKADEILVKVTHVAIQQVDLLYARGQHQNNNPKKGHVHPPFTLGLDFAGIVISTPQVRSSSSAPPLPSSPLSEVPLVPGDRVFGTHQGAFATHIAVPQAAIHRVPPGLGEREAAALAGSIVSFAAVRDIAAVRPGHRVLVTGAPGHLALAAAQAARARGAEVFLLARNATRAAAVRHVLGKGITVLPSADGREWKDDLRRLTAGKGVDIAIDNVGVVGDSLSLLAFGGTIVLVGFAGRDTGDVEKLALNRVLLKGARLIGFRFGEAVRQGHLNLRQCWLDYLECVSRGDIRAVVDDTEYSTLADVGRAMDDLEGGVLVGKAVVHLSGNSGPATEERRRQNRL